MDLDYRILAANKAYRDAYAPNESVVGRRCHEVSHHFAQPCDEAGESCPRRTALASQRTERVLHIHHTPRGDEHVQVELNPVRDGSGEVKYFVERMQSLPTARAAASSEGLTGRAPRFRQMLQLVGRVAATETSVLLLGETGTGKEMIAGAIHFNSPRKEAPFVKINCAAITETLLESELFGHEKGAFTGAYKRKEGRFLQAHRGSLFLDEVSEMSPAMQVKLLRVLQEREFIRVGGEELIRVDVRVIAATNKDLLHEIETGRFREDLYYRLNVVTLVLPPLRRRREDIPLLAQHFLRVFSEKNRKKMKGFTPQAMDRLLKHEWPGNVRELMNAVERGVVLARTDYLDTADLPLLAQEAATPLSKETLSGDLPLDEVEKATILNAMEITGGNKSEAARRLGITRKTLHTKLKKYSVPS